VAPLLCKMAESSGMGEPTDTDQHASAVAMPELDELLCLESTICERLMATDGEGALTHALPSATVLNHRTLFVKMIWRIREKRPAQFLDPLVFYLAVAYVDGVLWAECAPDKLKQSPAMPLACLLLAMKVCCCCRLFCLATQPLNATCTVSGPYFPRS
jgi:hypothetical protein